MSSEPNLDTGTDTDPDSADAPTGVPAGTDAPTGTRFVFMDTEATGLDHRRHELTEVAWVVRFEDGREEQRRYFPTHTTDGADDDALELTHYDERIAPQDKTPSKVWLTEFLEHADGAVLVGAVPDFDARHLDLACQKLGVEPTWDHHLLDVETLALPLIAPGPESPRSLAKTCAALGIPHDKDQAHGALYDALQAMRVFDRVWELVADLRSSGDPLPPPVPRVQPQPDDATTRSDGETSIDGVANDDATAHAVEASEATGPGRPGDVSA
ncbi:MAG: 3'-5' exonuclease [Nitriliruptor sp.]|uniref:3'-5' exonuclease n=1 Tax=Nitriliruptor sp. TaxID=2448056 RepID=UPI0034A060FF